MTQDLKTRIENIYALDREAREEYGVGNLNMRANKARMKVVEKIPEMVEIIRSLEAKVKELEKRLNDK